MHTLTCLTLSKDVRRLPQTEVDASGAPSSGRLLNFTDSGYDEPRKVWASGKMTSAVSLVALILGGLAGSALAQGASKSEGFINPNDIKWGAAPPAMPKGAKIAVLQGDPGKSGPFVIRLMVPPGYKIPPHWHSQDESLTVIAGALYFGPGDKIETSKAHTLTAGGFHFLAGKDHHYLVAKSQAVVQINGNGPFDVTYIASDDDPQKAKK
jgi:hypothetical protein